jgi:lipoprotein NlpD
MGFIWPASGQLLAGFDEARNKGSTSAARPVIRCWPRPMGGWCIPAQVCGLWQPHHPQAQQYLSDRLRTQSDLAGQRRPERAQGQKIAEMGSTDADRVKLHFEIRRQGKPVDPSRFLPSR